MAGALGAVAALIALVALLLALPIAVEFQVQRIASVRGRIRIDWLFGLVRRQFEWPLDAAPRALRSGRAHRARQRRNGRGHSGAALRLFRDAAFRRRTGRLARDLVEAARFHGLSLRARLGLGDPADTGRLWAWIGPLSAAGRSLARVDLRIEPDFVAAVFEFDARGRCRLVPLRFLALVASFLLSPVTIRAWRQARSGDG